MDREPKNEGIDLPVPGAVVIKPNAAIPGNMHEFERDSRVHVFLITMSVIIVAFLINYGFEMLSLYGDLQKTVPNIGAVSQANRGKNLYSSHFMERLHNHIVCAFYEIVTSTHSA